MVVRHLVGVEAEEADAVSEGLGDSVEGSVKDSGTTGNELTVEDSGDEMACIVEDTFCDDWDTALGADLLCRDKKLEPLVNFRRVKTSVFVKRAKVIHDFDLNEPSVEEKALAAKHKEERDFDLNKLSIAGMFQLEDPSHEPEFIKMLRLLLPSFY